MLNANDLLNPSVSEIFCWQRFVRIINDTSIALQGLITNSGPQSNRSAPPPRTDSATQASTQFVESEIPNAP